MILKTPHIAPTKKFEYPSWILFLLVLFSMATGTSCYRDDLCYDHPHYPKIRIEVDLSQANITFDELKSYMAVFIPIDDGVMPLEKLRPIEHRMQSASDFYISLAPGKYSVYIYNDYSGQNRFITQSDYADLTVEAISASSKYRSKGVVMDIPYAPEPDILVFDKIDTLNIHDSEGVLGEQIIRLQPRRITLTVNIKIKVMNLSAVSEYIGELGEVDTRCHVREGTYDNGKFAIPLTADNSTVQFDNNRTDGTVDIKLNTFGFTKIITRALTNGNTRNAYIYLNFKLSDGSFFDTGALDLTSIVDGLDTEKGEIFISIGVNSTDLYPPIQIPNVGSSGAGLDTKVGEWGEEDIREIIVAN